MRLLAILIFINIVVTSTAQSITKKAAIKIVREDTVATITRIEFTKLIFDTLEHISVWVVREKINVKKWKKHIKKATPFGVHSINADELYINATTGAIIARKKVQVGWVHYAPNF